MSTCWSKTCSLSPVPPGRPAVARWRPGGAAGGLEEPGPRPGGAAWGLDPEGSTTAPAWGPGGGECLHQTGNIQGGSQGTAFTSSSFISLKKKFSSIFILPSISNTSIFLLLPALLSLQAHLSPWAFLSLPVPLTHPAPLTLPAPLSTSGSSHTSSSLFTSSFSLPPSSCLTSNFYLTDSDQPSHPKFRSCSTGIYGSLCFSFTILH